MKIQSVAHNPSQPHSEKLVHQAQAPLRAANDNDIGISGDELLKAALRHFAQFGLSAAQQAKDNADQAFFANDRAAYHHWLAICRALDKRMASAIAYRHDRALQGGS